MGVLREDLKNKTNVKNVSVGNLRAIWGHLFGVTWN